MRILIPLTKELSLSQYTILTNMINSKIIYIRLSVEESEDMFIFESCYYLTYEEGLIPFQVINNAKILEGVTVDALNPVFMDYLKEYN